MKLNRFEMYLIEDALKHAASTANSRKQPHTELALTTLARRVADAKKETA